MIFWPSIQQASTAAAGLLRTTLTASGSLLVSASMAASHRSIRRNACSAIGGHGSSGHGLFQATWLSAWPLSRSNRARSTCVRQS